MRGLCALGLLLGLVLPSQAMAGPWTKTLGEYYTKLAADFYSSTSYVHPETGEEVEGLAYLGQQYSFFLEAGLLRRWPLQLSAQLPLTIGTTRFPDESVFAEGEVGVARSVRLGDLRVQLQTSILRRGFQLAPAVEVKVPLYRNGEIGGTFGVWSEAFPLPGDGQIDVTGWLLMGGAIPGAPIFMEGGVGYRARTEAFISWETDLEFVDGIPFLYGLGVSLPRGVVMARLEGIKNLRADAVTRESLSVGVSLLVDLWRGLALEARFAGEAWTNNAARGIAFGAGLSWRLPYAGYVPSSERADDEAAED